MEDEIDLQRYFMMLVNNWKWIAGVAILFAVVTFLVNKLMLSPTYEAKALVVVTQPRYSITFDPRFETETKTDLKFFKPLAQLATADELLEELLQQYNGATGKNGLTLKKLKAMTNVEADNTSSFVQLFVASQDPEMAAELVNLWAELFVIEVNEIFGEGVDNTVVLIDQLEQAVTERAQAEQALAEFEAQNQLKVYNAQLKIAEDEYQNLLLTQAELEQLIQDVNLLRTQLKTLPANQEVSLESELTLLLLQLKAFGVDEIPLQFQLDPQTATPRRTARQMTAYLDSLSDTIQNKIDEIDSGLEPLNEEILALQRQIEVLEATSDRLEENLQIAKDTHLTLARKLEETQISNQVTSTVKLASRASVPTDPVSPKTTLNTLIAAVVGVLLTIFAIFVLDFWKEAASDYQTQESTMAKPSEV